MGYNEDLLPLADQINIVFKLELSSELSALINKYGDSLLSSKNSKKEFSLGIKKALRKVIKNLSEKYITGIILDKYFSEDGFALFISNILIDLSKSYINEQSENINKVTRGGSYG
ncbi:MAG: hypothetical protein H8D97_01830 [Proteobacteria bacterium]|nr:hypothetical protein [Pseudomonadota bacterium]